MKSLLTIPLSQDVEILAQIGKKVNVGDIIAKKPIKPHKEKILISKILSIPPTKITLYLTKRLGGKVAKGEVLAKKDTVFKSIRVLSPINGIIDSVDLKDGTLLILSTTDEEVFERSPINGIIEGINEDEIVISFEGKVLEGEKGRGDRAIGISLIFNSNVDIFDFASEVEGKIIIARSVTSGARSKLSALGAKGIISLEYYDDFPVELSLSERNFKELIGYPQTNIILLGEKKRIIIPVASN